MKLLLIIIGVLVGAGIGIAISYTLLKNQLTKAGREALKKAEEDGELILVDYKTDRVAGAQELRDRYQIQLDLYARALQQITGKRVREKLIYSVSLQETISL
jgi:uncharacterized protein YpmB